MRDYLRRNARFYLRTCTLTAGAAFIEFFSSWQLTALVFQYAGFLILGLGGSSTVLFSSIEEFADAIHLTFDRELLRRSLRSAIWEYCVFMGLICLCTWLFAHMENPYWQLGWRYLAVFALMCCLGRLRYLPN